MDFTLFETFSHLTIMMWKVDQRAEGGVRILILESSIKAIEMRRVLEKAQLIQFSCAKKVQNLKNECKKNLTTLREIL
jgi:hypothetical protein